MRTYAPQRCHADRAAKKLVVSRPTSILFATIVALAIATLARASTSPQVEELAPLVVPRTAHTATVLFDGRVLIVGGRDAAGTALSAAEIFDPATQTCTAMGALLVARTGHTATLLNDGRVLIAGGTNATGALTSAEIFDPSALEAGFRLLPANMGTARTRHTATLLSSGNVLVAGGDNAGTAEVFDPLTESFSSMLFSMADLRSGQTATLFPNDIVLFAGGQTDSMEFFNSADQTFTLDLNRMSVIRTGQQAIALSDTRLLLFGGEANNTIEEFNFSTDTLTLKTGIDAPASSATLLANDKILVLGLDMAGIYDPDAADQASLNQATTSRHKAGRHGPKSRHSPRKHGSGRRTTANAGGALTSGLTGTGSAFTAFDEVSVPGSGTLLRNGQTATEIRDGRKILVAGGVNAQNDPVAPVALFNPARIWTDKDDYAPDEPVVLSGAGWKANENIYLFAVDSETDQWTYESTISADPDGEFSVSPFFIVQLRHLGETFDATAMGAVSTMIAKVRFTDAGNFGYTPTTQSLTIPFGSNSSFTQSITDPRNNGALTAAPVVTGTGGNPLTTSWVSTSPTSLSFAATPTTAQTLPWSVTITVPPGTAAGTYTGNIKATATGSGATPGSGPGTDLTIIVPPGPAAKLALSSATSDLAAGGTRVLTATIQDANGNTITSGANSTLSVTFAKTSGTGTITGLGSTNAVAGVATLTVTGSQVGSVEITASAGALAAGTGNPITFNVVAGAPSKLALSGSTADLTAGSARVLTATIQDAAGNTITTGANSTLSVTFAKTTGAGTVTGLSSSTASGGVATITVTGGLAGSITISASANPQGGGGPLAAGTGNPIAFNVVVGSASKLALSGSTADLTAGSTRVLTATIQDAGGNTITTGADSTLSVTFTKTSGAGSVTGLGSNNAAAGVATKTVTGDQIGSVTITASATGSGGALTASTGNPITFNVAAGALHHFGFATIATPQTAGTPFSITVTAQDSSNNAVTIFDGNGFKVNLTSTGTLVFANPTAAFVSGVLTTNVTITNTGTFTITATGLGGNSGVTGTSNSFQVNPGIPTKLAFSQQPTTTTAGQTISPAVTVQIQDFYGNLTTSTGSVGIAILNNPSSSTLSGGTPAVAAVSGTATFSSLSINKGGVGYTLQATSGVLTPATSAAFTINNPAATLASIAPTSANLSDTLDVVFNGTGYIDGVSSVNFGPEITVNTTTVNSSIKITANITIGTNATVGARNVSVTNSGPGGGTSGTQSFTVNNPATTTIVESSANPSTYGDSATFTATISTVSGTPTGSVTFYNSATCSGTVLAGPTNLVNGQASFNTSSLSAPGHTITACYTPTGIYLASNGSVTQTVNPATPTVTVSFATSPIPYDGNTHPASASVTGVGGADITTGHGAVTISYTPGNANAPVNAGSYTASAHFASTDGNYTDADSTTPASLAINKVHLAVTADDQSRPYGASNPMFTAKITGFVNNETVAVVSGSPNFSGSGPSSTPTTTVGDYEITPEVGTLTATNYDFTPFVNGVLHITKAHLTVTADYKSKTYDTAPFTAFTATLSGFVNSETSSVVAGSADFTGNAVGAVNAGTYTITPTIGTLSATNYDFPAANFVSGTLKIKKAVAIVTVSGYTGIYDGFAHGATGSVTGVDAGGTAAGSSLSVGAPFTNYPGGTAYWTFSGGINYTDQNGSVAIVINKAHLTVTADDKSKTFDNAVYSPFTATLSGFVNGETAAALRLSGALSGNAGFTGNAVTAINAETYTITPTAGNLSATNYDFTTFYNGTLTISKAHLTVTADPKSKQYSDPFPTFTATYSGFVSPDNSNVVSGTPAFTTTATQFSGPGTYDIIPALGTLSATNYDFTTFKKGTLTVTQEDARATYTGALFVSTSSATSSTATVTLSATVQDITAVTGDPAYDAYPGDIRNAKVSFINRDTNTVIVSNLPVGLVSAGDAKAGTATYNWNVNIGTNDSVQYTIGIIVTGYYTRNASTDNTVATVSKLIPGSINGGGYLVVQSSAGLYPGGPGTKNNFGFNVKNVAKTGPKGNINTIIRNNGRVYQIKGNAMTSLATKLATIPSSTSPSTATFNGKANIQDITNPLAPISIDGNATLQVQMSDAGEPGANDAIAVTVWNKSGGLWFSSTWNGTKTVEQKLGGGNLVVR